VRGGVVNFWEADRDLLRSYSKPFKTSENLSEPLRTHSAFSFCLGARPIYSTQTCR
jgi:hypothetical protein